MSHGSRAKILPTVLQATTAPAVAVVAPAAAAALGVAVVVPVHRRPAVRMSAMMAAVVMTTT